MNFNTNDAAFFMPSGHMVLIYENESEVIKTITSFIRKKLAKNEQIMYITGDANTQLIIDALKELGVYDKSINKGQLLILDKENTYSIDGEFNPDKMINLIITEVNKAVKNGYEGLAISGELSWVLDYKDGIENIIEYEWKLNEKVFNRYAVSSICRYNINKFSERMISQVIELHPYLIWKEKIHENPFYIPAEGYRNNEIDKYRVKVWLKNINAFTNIKSDFNKEIQKKTDQLREFRYKITNGIVISLTKLLSIHDPYTKDHSYNVADIAQKMARELFLPEKTIQEAYYAGLLHDVGKVLISNDILQKKTALTTEEYEIVKRHAQWGYETLIKSQDLKEIAEYVLYHHERWDGLGYPYGLKGATIPLISRVLAIADTYDAMTSNRSYRLALSKKITLEEIEKNAGKQFDPQLVKLFISMHREKVIG